MELTRRHFLGASGAGAATLAVMATGPGGEAAFGLADEADRATISDPVMLHVVDARSGEVSLLVGEDEVTFTDPKLVARIARAAR